MNSRQTLIHNLRDSHAPIPMENTKPTDKLADIFAADVFGDRELERALPGSSFKAIMECKKTGRQIPENIADQIANAMKEWAISRGATHFTHWFQPMTGLTAEKHDSFLQTTMNDDHLLLRFSGKELIKGEPDASSFPSGGIRSTFEARGYTAWDMTSPAFIRNRRNGSVLYIPTCFCSWTGEALDKKTPLLRSQEVLSREGTRLLNILGTNATSIVATLGVEQEFFLIDRGFYLKRPDLIACGRTLLGARPPKGQELEDHYFGSMNTRILACIQELEWELWRLGVPTKTRHNEVAPGQYEIAPIFETASLASDHNMLTMQLLKDIAPRHGLECLLHEKPFAGVNGSGKHCNWSMSTEDGENLLEPGKTPARNAQFMVFLSAVIRAVDLYADLLRISIVTPGNDYRLGANEAPPAIISIYLGRELDAVCLDIIKDDGTAQSEPVEPVSPLSSGGTSATRMKLGVTSLPTFPRDSTDRNRTSPFAFTGNKFEFRAVGSSQTVSRPVMMLNTIVAESLHYMGDQIEKQIKSGINLTQAIQNLVRDTLKKHYRIVFNGNGYSQDWIKEAAKRGLPHLRTAPDALGEFLIEKNVRLFAEYNVLSQTEVIAHRNIMYENYVKALSIEAAALHSIATTFILPACIVAQGKIAKAVKQTMDLLGDKAVETQKELVKQMASKIQELMQSIEALKKEIEEGDKLHHAEEEEGVDPLHAAVLHSNRNIMGSMKKCRDACDALELMMDNSSYPLPTYAEILFIR